MTSQQHGLGLLHAFQAAQVKVETPELYSILQQMMTDGLVRYEWPLLLPYIQWKLQQVVLKLQGDNPKDVAEALNTIEGPLASFTNAPFTIQRICELLCEPERYYTDPTKFLRGFEKLVRVNSMLPVTTATFPETAGISQVPEQGNRTPAAVWVPATAACNDIETSNAIGSTTTQIPQAESSIIGDSTLDATASVDTSVVDDGPKDMEE